MTAPLPDYAPRLHYGQRVWDDEDGETYWIEGHVEPRRAIAAANRYARVECGLRNLVDEHGVFDTHIEVRHRYFRKEPQPYGWDELWVPTTAEDLWGKPFTEVSL